MPTGTDSPVETRLGWTYRFRPSPHPGSPLLVLLHGWTGDENSMWVFAGKIPADRTVLAPRAPFQSPDGGYSWRERGPGERSYPTIQQLWAVSESLLTFLDRWVAETAAAPSALDLAGFSQGAATAVALLLKAPERIRRVAALSGFLPAGTKPAFPQARLTGREVLVTHGRQDEIVPVEMAHELAGFLEAQGATVHTCITDGGHKVSRDCMQTVGSFFAS
jgi:phospholipase/carboxylesterase